MQRYLLFLLFLRRYEELMEITNNEIMKLPVAEKQLTK